MDEFECEIGNDMSEFDNDLMEGDIREPLDDEENWQDGDESMDGDHASALASAGFGTDEDYGGFDSIDRCDDAYGDW